MKWKVFVDSMLAMNTAICYKQTAALKWVLDEVYRDMPIATEVQPQPTVEEKEQQQQPPQQQQEDEEDEETKKSGNEQQQQHKEEDEDEEDEGLL